MLIGKPHRQAEEGFVYDEYVLQDNVVIDMTIGETQEVTRLQEAAFRYRDKGFSLWDLSESEATLSAPIGKGWKMALFTLLLSLLIPVVGTAVRCVWYFCLLTADIKLMWIYEGELVETKRSMLGTLMRF